MRFSEAGGRFSHGHISRVASFFSSFFRGPVAEAPPEHCVKKTRVKTVWMVFFAVSAFLVVFRTFLRRKMRRYTFSGPLPFLFNTNEQPVIPSGLVIKMLGQWPRKGISFRFLPKKGTKKDQQRENSKKHHPDRFDPSFFHTMLGGGLGNRASKKTGEKKLLPGRYGHAKNDLPPPRTAYLC